jgi:tRNA pseudouridine38-40 synthase
MCTTLFETDVIEIYGAGRTDAGVHAIGQVAHLDVTTTLSPQEIQHKLNEKLPTTIHILSIEAVHPRFHARHHAKARSYVYIISQRRSALFKRNVWWTKESLNCIAMQQASKLFIGLHDFSSFGRLTKKDESPKVEIQHISIQQQGDTIMIHIIGSHFLWNQVRRMIGVLVEVGKGKMNESHIADFMKTTSERPSQLTAPASGLYLEHVYYEGESVSLAPHWPLVVW